MRSCHSKPVQASILLLLVLLLCQRHVGCDSLALGPAYERHQNSPCLGSNHAAAKPASCQKSATKRVPPTPLVYTVSGVAAAQQHLQLDGAGISICVMDSGLNYKHPAFGACQKPGKQGRCRVHGGWNYLGNAQDLVGGLASVKPDGDPMECNLNETHGTEVASIAAGDASYDAKDPWRGVAYGSSLLAYKVSGGCAFKAGAVSTQATLEAIRRATSEDADVLNLSWGDFRAGGYVDSDYDAALTAAVQHGALISIAAGNNGLMGPFFTEAGVMAQHVLSVASVDVKMNFTGTLLEFGVPATHGKQRMKSIAAFGPTLPPATSVEAARKLAAKLSALRLPLRVVPVAPDTACSSIITSKPLLQGQIALVKRGGCSFESKVAAAAAAGAAAVIVYANTTVDKFTRMDLDHVPAIPAWGLQMQQGKVLLAAAQAAAGSKNQQQQPPPPKAPRLISAKPLGQQPYKVTVKPSSFSSWGPAVTLEMLPSLSAPGSEMRAATAGAEFTHVEGTSFAAPFVSGALALWKQAYRNRLPPWQTAARMSATAAAAAASSTAAAATAAQQPQQQQSQHAAAMAVESAQPGTTAPGKHEQKHPVKTAASAAAPPHRTGEPAHRSSTSAAAARSSASSSSSRRRAVGAPLRGSAPAATGLHSAQPATNPNRASSSSGNSSSPGSFPSLQESAYAAFVSTAQPVAWAQATGWAQPVARVGAGLVQVDAAIHNPTVVQPNHLLLRSNQASQTLNVTVTNTAPFEIAYQLGHKPAAAMLIEELWFAADPDVLLKPLAANVRITMGGRPISHVQLMPGHSTTVQVTFSQPQGLMAHAYVYSGYVTLTPAVAPLPQQPAFLRSSSYSLSYGRSTPGASNTSTSGTTTALPSSSLAAAEAEAGCFKAVPLVIPYQGSSQNYTNLPILPTGDAQRFPRETEALKGLLHVCYATYDATALLSPPMNNSNTDSTIPPSQDGTLGSEQVDKCLATRPHESDMTHLPLDSIVSGKGVLMLSAALQRPALKMSLMLFDTVDCGRSNSSTSSVGHSKPGSAAAGAAAAALRSKVTVEAGQQRLKGCQSGAAVAKPAGLVGEVWRYLTPSRDYPGSLWAYYSSTFKGNVTVRDSKTDEVLGHVPVKRGRSYRMQLWLVAPLAAADRAAGEVYKTWKFDIPGGFKFV